jgi:hypothetical protein
MRTFRETWEEGRGVSEARSDEDDRAEIHVQDHSGVWRKAASTRSDPQYILIRMREIQSARGPDARVRAVDSKGRLLDILPGR